MADSAGRTWVMFGHLPGLHVSSTPLIAPPSTHSHTPYLPHLLQYNLPKQQGTAFTSPANKSMMPSACASMCCQALVWCAGVWGPSSQHYCHRAGPALAHA
jgi:hypothetical protein